MITKVESSGYRLLHEFEADLGTLTVVIGANGSGKSTLIDFLGFVAHCAEFPVNTVLGWHWGMFSLMNAGLAERKLRWAITLEKLPVGSVWALLPLEVDRQIVYEAELTADPQGQASVQYEALRRAEPLPGYSEPFKFLEATAFKSFLYDRRQHRLVAFDEAIPQTSAAGEACQPTGSGDLQALPIAAKEAALRLSQMRFFNEFPIPSSVRVLLANMAFYPGIEVGRSSAVRVTPSEIRPETTLTQNGENLGAVLHEILTRYDFKSASIDLMEFFKAAYPWVEDVNAETAYGGPPKVLVRVRERGLRRPMELWELSDGMLRFLSLGVALLNPRPPPFIAIDEPEAGLHPRLLPIVGDMVKAASEKTQVLVTTHSPELLGRFSIDEVAVIFREGARAVWKRPANRKTLVEMLKQVGGDTLGDLLVSGELEAAE